ncbi:MAG: transketolase C-terminal domain-containing protein, partial [Bdellovibrionota bacterium]
HQGKGPVFIHPTGTTRKAKDVFSDPAKWQCEAGEDVWVPGSIMGKGIAHWEEGIIATIHGQRKGKPLAKPVNYHDGNLKGEDTEKILSALALTPVEQSAIDRLRSGSTREETFKARPKWDSATSYDFSFPKPFPVSKSARLANGKHGADWLSPRKGVNVALKELSEKNKDYLMAVDMDLGGSTQLAAMAGPIGARFVQAGIRERGGVLAAAGAAYGMLRNRAASGNGKIPSVCTGTFAAFLQGVGREGLEFIDYQQDLWGYDAGGLTTGLPVKVISSHNGLNPGKDGITAHGLHGIDLVYELPRLRRAFVPADANHAIHIIKEMFRLADYSMYIGPRDLTPVIAKPGKPEEPLFGPDWKWESVSLVEKTDGAKAALLVTGPILYRALMAKDELSKKKIATDVYFVGQVKPFPAAKVRELLSAYDRLVTLEDGFVGAEDSARGLAGLVSGCLAQGLSEIAKKRSGSLPRLGKIGSRAGQTMSQEPDVIYDQYGLSIEEIVRCVEGLS